MTKAERRLERALRLTPPVDRARRESEWRADFVDARRQGLEEEVARATRSMAVRLRLRQTGRVLFGSNGAGAAILAWSVLCVIVLAASLVASPVIMIVFLVSALAMMQAGLPSRGSHWLLLISTTVGVLSFAYVWWVLGVSIDAADAGTPEPELAAWGGVGLVGLLLGIVGFVASAAVAVAHERSRAGHGA